MIGYTHQNYQQCNFYPLLWFSPFILQPHPYFTFASSPTQIHALSLWSYQHTFPFAFQPSKFQYSAIASADPSFMMFGADTSQFLPDSPNICQQPGLGDGVGTAGLESEPNIELPSPDEGADEIKKPEESKWDLV